MWAVYEEESSDSHFPECGPQKASSLDLEISTVVQGFPS